MNFDLALKEIDTAYRSLKHKLGWRFLCVSRHVLESNPKIALITANPGGDHIPIGHGTASCEDGCAYLSEEWGNAPRGEANLQRQVQLLFETIARTTSFADGFSALMERSLIAYFIPFRSPRLAQLPRKDESIAFAQSLWSRLFHELHPKLVVTIDPDAFRYIGYLLQQRIDALPARHEVSSTGWGNVKAETKWYETGSNITSLVRLPHLSTFKLFSRIECRPYTDAIIGRACEHF